MDGAYVCKKISEYPPPLGVGFQPGKSLAGQLGLKSGWPASQVGLGSTQPGSPITKTWNRTQNGMEYGMVHCMERRSGTDAFS